MPFNITCHTCQRLLRVPDEGAGKHVKCPQCQTVVLAPLAGGAPEIRTETAERWHVKGQDGQNYGPVTRPELDAWCQEGRLSANSQVLREGSNQWQWATDLYPHLAQSAVLGGASAGMPASYVSAGNPALGPSPATFHNPYGGVAVNPYTPSGYSNPGNLSDKSKIAAGLLGIFLGAYGIHRFYLGDVGIGVAQIFVTLATCGIGGIWGPIEGIMILCGAIDRDAYGRKLRD